MYRLMVVGSLVDLAQAGTLEGQEVARGGVSVCSGGHRLLVRVKDHGYK